MTDDDVPKYELAEDLHDLPHLNLSLQDTTRVFNFTDKQYIQSLEVYCLSGVALGLLLFITFGVIQCCIGCRKCRGYHLISYRMKQYNPVLTSFLFICSLGIMCVSTVCLYYGVGKVQTNVNDISNYVRDVSQSIDDYNSLISDIEDNIISLENQTSFPFSKKSPFAAKLEDLQAELEHERIPDFRDDLNRMLTYNRARELVTAALIVTQMFSCATILIGVCYGRVFVLHCSLVMLTGCMFVSSTLIGLYLAGAVASADICIEHNGFLDYVREIASVTEDVVNMFLHCKDSTGDDSVNTLGVVGAAIMFIHKIIGSSDTLLPAAHSAIDDINAQEDDFQRFFACQKIIKILHSLIQDYNKILAILCDPFLSNMCMYCLFSCISVFLIWFVINQLKPYTDRVEEWLRVEGILDKNITMTPDTDEGEPLVTSLDFANPPAYNRRDYGSSMGGYKEDDFQQHHSLYQSLLSSPYLASR